MPLLVMHAPGERPAPAVSDVLRVRPVEVLDDVEALVLDAITWIGMERFDIAGASPRSVRAALGLPAWMFRLRARALVARGALERSGTLLRPRLRLTAAGLAAMLVLPEHAPRGWRGSTR